LLRRAFGRFRRAEDGLETVEWAIVGVLVVIVALAAWSAIGAKTEDGVDAIAEVIEGSGGRGNSDRGRPRGAPGRP
jgi:Flp pilus assembly pilin Flp